MHKVRSGIIGLFVGLGLLFSQVPSAHAIYSPVLSKEVSRIKEDVFAARQENGVGTWVGAMEKIQKNNKELQKQGQASGVSGTFPLFSELAKKIVIQAATESFLDGFKLLIPAAYGISTCLRDDIWELEALQEEVLNEMFKSSLLSDLANSQKLYADYQQLQIWINGGEQSQTDPTTGVTSVATVLGLKKDGGKIENKWIWFPDSDLDYYVDCPFGSITMAIDEAKVSFNRMIDTFSGNFGSMGSIDDMWNIAKKRAVQKAAAYIAKNQLKISLGGETGANPEGLINGSGISGLTSTFETAKKLAVDTFDSLHAGELVGAVGKSVVGVAKALSNYTKGGDKTASQMLNAVQEAEDERKLAMDRIYAPLYLGLQLSYVSEESLKDIESTMVKINLKIQEASNQKSVPDMCNKLNAILSRQCPNKAANEPVNCAN